MPNPYQWTNASIDGIIINTALYAPHLSIFLGYGPFAFELYSSIALTFAEKLYNKYIMQYGPLPHNTPYPITTAYAMHLYGRFPERTNRGAEMTRQMWRWFVWISSRWAWLPWVALCGGVCVWAVAWEVWVRDRVAAPVVWQSWLGGGGNGSGNGSSVVGVVGVVTSTVFVQEALKTVTQTQILKRKTKSKWF